MNITNLLFGLLIVSSPAAAQVHISQDYVITPDTLDSGGGRSTSADYRMDTSIGLIVGVSSGGSPLETDKVGYIAQLYDVTALQLSATPTIINEGATSHLAVTQILDDNTTNSVLPSTVNWSVQSGPISGITANGLATAAIVYQNTAATVQGEYVGLTASLNLTVINTNIDNYGSYTGDQIDDAWQVQYFSLNNVNAGPMVDPDHDGQNNLFEYTAGVVPTDPMSRFKLGIEPVVAQALQKNLIFSPRFGDRTYTVKTSTTLGTGAVWSPLVNSTALDNGIERTVTDLNATGTQRFYVVEITRL